MKLIVYSSLNTCSHVSFLAQSLECDNDINYNKLCCTAAVPGRRDAFTFGSNISKLLAPI